MPQMTIREDFLLYNFDMRVIKRGPSFCQMRYICQIFVAGAGIEPAIFRL